ncbi:OPT/YSL family transporter [Candidatus Poseidoniaceae archaeon]|nr:OPT/YSL family transporter [Euryarchaeota archaeon]MDA9166509.1 OPT/YSL family transporter [Candidatus Poseidoniaceae archaeon]MDA8701167.1 OPT/YSL family transporter [Euryarchaeota archaeon]MDA8727712.1 OPT/YSL family transporter [Euryarchaeota archaeon]MDA8843450.1 OPT/YSL family transporter [Euryarchaeota archaeon]
MGVEKSAYRQPVTPQGLKAIEKGTLTWLDDDMYNNLNTGVLEQYLEEKNLEESFEVSHWSTPKVFYGIAIGAVFSGVTAYIGLKLGLAISAAWYIAYLLGMALKWSPSEVNIATSATTGATHASTGFIFTFPAIFLLASDPKYFLADGPLITNADTFNLAFVGIVASMFAGFLGIMYFIIFRRVWLVEDPLPLPGFEATLKMLDIASDVNTGAVEHARDSLKTIGWWTTITMGGLFLVEYPLVWANGKKWALLDFLAEKGHIGEYGLATFYSKGKIHQPSGIDEATGESLNYTQWSEGTAWNPFAYTYIGVALTPSMFAIGWFMKTRVAFLVNLGTLVGWFFLVPAVVYFNFPIYDASLQASIPIQDYADGGSASLQMIAFSKSVRTIAIGSIVGGGMFGLAKMWKTFVNIFADIGSAFKGEGSQEYMEGKGWYEWPLKHIPIFMGITFLAMILIFTIGGFSILASLVFATVLILTTFLLGAIAVRVMGETGIEPVSGTSFIVLLMLLGVFLNAQDLLQLNTQDAVLLGLVGTTVFGSAISMSGTVIGDYKNSLYIGNRPYHISKGNIMGVIPGAIIGAGVAIFLSKQLADGTIDLMAPQANAFATFSVIFAEREGDLILLALGFLLGMFVEWGTGMGTSFGLGMYLDVPHTLPMLIGGYSRDKWEEKRLTPKIEAIKEKDGATAAEKQRALILLSTFMVAAGLLTGEAFFGTESSILSFIDSLWIATPENETGTFFGIEEFSSSVQWYIGRMVGFIGLNVAIGGGIYYLFKRAGVIGGESVDAVLEN